jgi:hypothetical protein
LALNSPLRTASFLLTNGSFQLQLDGTAGSNYVIQASSDLVHWSPLATNTASNGFLYFSDTNTGAISTRFYRGVGQ